MVRTVVLVAVPVLVMAHRRRVAAQQIRDTVVEQREQILRHQIVAAEVVVVRLPLAATVGSMLAVMAVMV